MTAMTSGIETRRPERIGVPLALVSFAGPAAALLAVAAGPAAILLATLGLVAAAASVATPGILFAAYLLVPFYKGALQPYSPIDITVLMAALNTLQVVPLIRDRRAHSQSQTGLTLWFALALVILAGVLYSPDQDAALARAATWWALAVVPITMGAVRVGSDPRYLRQFLWTLFAMGAVVVILGAIQMSSSQRLVLLGENTIEVGRAALLAPLIGITFVLRGGSAAARFATIALLPMAVAVALASGSRGPLLAALLLGAIGTIGAARRTKRINWAALSGLLGLALASIVVVSILSPNMPALSIERFAGLGDFIQGTLTGQPGAPRMDASSEIRLRLFDVALSTFEQHPILGIGTAGFATASRMALGPIEGQPYPHNALLQVAAELGLVGLVVLLGLLALAVSRHLPVGDAVTALRYAFLFFFLNAMVSLDVYSDRMTWGLLLLLLVTDAARPGSRLTMEPLEIVTPEAATAQPIGVANAGRDSSRPARRRLVRAQARGADR